VLFTGRTKGRGKGVREEGGGRGAFAQGANICVVYVPLQETDYHKRSALHYASSNGLDSIVAKLLSLGADAALVDAVRTCSCMNTCMYMHVHISIRIYSYEGSYYNLYESLHLCIYIHRPNERKKA